jgi:hypothetical protein
LTGLLTQKERSLSLKESGALPVSVLERPALSDIIPSYDPISDSLRSRWDLTLLPHQLGLNGLSARLVGLVGVVLKHMIHLFKGPSAGLRDKEECPDEREETEYGEEDVSSVAGILDQGRSDETL